MKLKVTVAALLAASWAVAAWAAPIGTNDVARAMGNWRNRRRTLGAEMGRSVKDVRKVTNGEKAVYIVRFAGGGHLIAPTDTDIRPVIMFSDADDFDPDPNNPAWDLIGGGSKVVTPASAAPTSGNDSEEDGDESPSAAKNRARWAELLDDGNDNEADASEESVDEVRVAPLMTTKWNQLGVGEGQLYRPCFNLYTPSNYYCGCVATATAQILRKFAYMGPNAFKGVYENPYTRVNGTVTEMRTIGAPYDWASMPDVPTVGKNENLDKEPAKQREAIGHLTGDVGIMVGTDYGWDGSTSITYMGKLVFEKFFGYSSAMAMRGGNPYTGKGDLFERMLVSNFDAKLPVQIRISGHSIVGDGYGYTDGTIYYHLNFGWGKGGYWYNTPDDLVKEREKYTGFIGAVYNIFTNQNYSASTVIASGRVTRNGKAAAGVRVSAAATDDPEIEVASATTDEKGIYALFVPAGEYRVTALAEQTDRHEVSGETIARPLPCVSTIPVETGSYNYVHPDEASVGNAAHCDIELEKVEYEPEAEVSVGEATVGTDFAEALVPVAAKVVHYGQTADKARLVVILTPVEGGTPKRCDSDVFSGFAEYGFNASFAGLEAGVAYRVEAKVIMVGTGEQAGLGDGGFAASREFVWFDESASSFTAAKWSGEPVKVEDGGLVIACPEGTEATFTPEKVGATSVRILVKVRECECYSEGELPAVDGVAAVSAVARQTGKSELVVWGNGVWNQTGCLFDDGEANADVVIGIDFVRHSVRYGIGSWESVAYDLPTSVTSLTSVSFGGSFVLSKLQGTVWDTNLVRDANGSEYANFEAAKAAGATGVLSPLWSSTWNLANGSGSVDVNDPEKLITFTGESKVLRSETNDQGVVTHWYAVASDADIAANAAKYVKTTVDLGLAKAITEDSVVKIGDFAVARGSMTFKVEVDNVEVAKAAVNDIVRVRSDLVDSDPEDPENGWKRPSEVGASIGFDEKTHLITVTPPAGPRGFVRILIK